MFYNVAKASKEKEKYEEQHKHKRKSTRQSSSTSNNSDMEPGLFSRNFHHQHHRSRSKSPRSSYCGQSRSRSRNKDIESYLDDAEEPLKPIPDEVSEYESAVDSVSSKHYQLEDFLNVPACMLGEPLKDFDSQQENTFVVVANKFGKQVVFRFSKEKSLFCLDTQNLIRKTTIFMFSHQLFELGILLTIVTNCVFMAIDENEKYKIAEYVFAAIYTFEMVVKILARGFILHPYSYLRNSWNWLDFLVVIVGYVTMAPAVEKYSAFKTFRVLRALKTISTVKGLKAMVNTLLKSMKMMTDVMILTVFFIAIFSLIGLQLFIGRLGNRCVSTNNTTEILEKFEMAVICSNSSTGWLCDDGYVCLPNRGPNPLVMVSKDYGSYISYDNFYNSFLTTMQVITLDYWESVFNSVIAATGQACLLYFLLAVFLGPFYLLNLVLAIVSASYEMEVNGNVDKNAENEAREKIRRSASTYTFTGDIVVEFLHGESPVEMGHDGELMYTVEENLPPVEPEKDQRPNQEISKCRMCIKRFSTLTLFEGCITFCIILNTVLMASEHYNMDQTQEDFINHANYVFTTAFIIEMIIKLIADTPRGYVNNRWNCFDGTLVLLSIVDIAVTVTQSLKGVKGVKGRGSSENKLKILKVFRLLRVLKLAQSWKTMGQLLSTIASSLGALGNVTVILGLIIYIFSVVGMNLFKSSYDPKNYLPVNDDPDDYVNQTQFPRWNFSNFGYSFMMVFRILCGKWIEPQWWLLEKKKHIESIIFILLVFVIGRWVVLNLFLALLLSSFGGDALSRKGDESDLPKKSRLQKIVEWTKKKKSGKKKRFPVPPKTIIVDNIAHPEHVHIEYNGEPLLSEDNSNNILAIEGRKGNDYTMKEQINIDGLSNGITSNGDAKQNYQDSEDSTEGLLEKSKSVELYLEKEYKYVQDCLCRCCYNCSCCFPNCFCCVSSYLISPVRRFWHNLRYYMNVFIDNKYFECVILFLIAFSSLTLVFEDIHLEKKPKLQDFLNFCNTFFGIIFTLEFLIKLLALGFVKYFTNFWNLLDVFIVAISLTTLINKSKKLNALRSLRGLRPLRAISRFEGMKVVVNALVYSVPSIANVLLVCMVFWLIFSICGYNLFGGQFWSCRNGGKHVHFSKVDNRNECLAAGYNWTNALVHFDDSLNGFLPLFQTATLEGWFEVMDMAQDIRGKDKNPGYQVAFVNQFFFVIFILLGSFFILNLFIGVIIDNFNRLKQKYEDGADIYLSPAQRNWINTLKAASLQKPSRRLIRPKSKWRSTLFDFISTKYFEFFIMSVIVLNMMTMMIQSHNQSSEVENALEYLNYVFTGIFTIEAVIRLIAMRLEYFKSGMNVFDFVVVVFSITVIIMEMNNEQFPISPGLFRVIRILRLGRLLRFLESAKGIRKLLFTIIKSAPALRNIGTLLFLITFIYATIGMNLYQKIEDTKFINNSANFKTFIGSFCLLFRIATAAGWNGVLDSAMQQGSQRDVGVAKNVSIIFFCSYIILMNLIIINMYIAVILENFNQANLQDDAGITEDDLEAFYVVWEKFDPKATQFIKYSMLSDFIDALDPPLRVPKPNYFFLESADIPIKPDDDCHCLDIMKALIKRSLGDPEVSQTEGSCDDITGISPQEERENLESVLEKVEQKYDMVFPLRKKDINIGTTKSRLRLENSAAKTIQIFFRKHLLLERIDLLSNSHNMSQRAREKNVVAVEHLVTELWKRKDDHFGECDKKACSLTESDEIENSYVAKYTFIDDEISTKPNEL